MYKELEKLISAKNNRYNHINFLISVAKNEDQLQKARAYKARFIHEYAQALYDFVWEKKELLTAQDCIAFDLVPYAVWRNFSERYGMIIDVIKTLKQAWGYRNV